MGKDYRRLKAWQMCDELAVATYRETRRVPREEVFGLRSQLRRSALSAPTNIVEGCARRTQKDYLSFLNRAEASLEEAGYLIGFAARLSYLEPEASQRLLAMQDEAARILRGLTNRIARDLRR